MALCVLITGEDIAMRDLSSDELLAIARMRGAKIGHTVHICGQMYRMCITESGSEYLHSINEYKVVSKVA